MFLFSQLSLNDDNRSETKCLPKFGKTLYSNVVQFMVTKNNFCLSENGTLQNKAYRPNAHLLYIVMHYNGNII